MAQSIVDACNSALQRCGAAPILSITDNSPAARACQVAFDSNRRDELRKHPWTFAVSRAVLAPDTAAPAFDYTYAYTVPSDCVRVLRPDDPTCDWVIEGGKILSNYGPVLYLRYIRDVEDVAQWDPSFYNTFAGALAIDIVERLTQSNVKKQDLMRLYQEDIRMARRMNAFEAGPVTPQEDAWIIARY